MPTVTTHRFLPKKNDLSQKRRELWIAAIKRDDLTETKLKYQKVCSKHFITGKCKEVFNVVLYLLIILGKPAALEDENHPDWVPSQHMGHISQIVCHAEGVVERKTRVEKRRKLTHEVITLFYYILNCGINMYQIFF